MNPLLPTGLFFLGAAAAVAAPLPTPIPLWSGPAPQSHGTAPADIPEITPFLVDDPLSPTPAIVICPGGAYGFLAIDTEGYNEARWFQAHGVSAFVLKYRLPTAGYRHPVPLLDAQRAIRLVRSRADGWKIDAEKVGIMGFSAGGHLASTLETHFDSGDPGASDPVDQLGCRPDFAVLVYPVISMKDGLTHPGSKANLLGPNPDPALVANLSNETQVTSNTPPTLLIIVDDDTVVPPDNSRLMYAALRKAGVSSELQEYPHGGHGFGYGKNPDPSPPGWIEKMGHWLQGHNFMP
jgi:acetyl esterase/lipase